MGAVDEENVEVAGIDKVTSIPNGNTKTTFGESVGDIVSANPVRSALAVGLPGGTAALAGIAASPKVADTLGFDRPVAGHRENFDAASRSPVTADATPSPFGDDNSSSSDASKLPPKIRTAAAQTPEQAAAAAAAATATAATTETNKRIKAITDTQTRVNRARARAPSSSTQGGSGNIFTKVLLGT